jgi:guanylate kinase
MKSRSPAPDPFHREQPSLLVVISGPSGVGKDSVVQRMKERGFPVHFVVTATDRPPRPTEVHGRDYYFYTTAEFEQMIARGELLEHACVYGQHKGIPRAHVRQALNSDQDVVMRCNTVWKLPARRWPRSPTLTMWSSTAAMPSTTQWTT